LKQHLIQLYNQGDEITITHLLDSYFQKKVKYPTSLMAVYKHKVEKMQRLLGKDYTQSTLSKYSQMAKAVQEFIKLEFNNNDIQLSNLKRSFLDDLELFLRTNRGMKPISSNKVLQGLKSVVMYALEREWIERDPFLGHSFKRVETVIKFLTNEQIIKLENTIITQQRLELVKQLFLFSIYTGLHYADAMSLTNSNLVKGIDSNPWIDYIRGKTGKRIQIPLLNKAQSLLVKFRSYGLKEDYLIPRITNQKLNSYLKEIADIVGIEVSLTHKIARKTFGSILLFNNVPIKVVSELMGHSNSIITEKHYAKLDTRKLGEAMRLLE
jgi:site-specific recombinase XerD